MQENNINIIKYIGEKELTRISHHFLPPYEQKQYDTSWRLMKR